MSFYDDYRDAYPTPGSETLDRDELEAIRARLRILERKVSRLLPEETSPEEALKSFDKTCCKFRGMVSQLHRELERRIDREANPGAPHLKHRLSRVAKTLSAPGEGAAFLKKAMAAYRSGPDALRRFAQAERAAGRLE